MDSNLITNSSILSSMSESDQAAQLQMMIREYAFDPGAMIYDLCGEKLDPWQERAFDKLLDSRFVAIRSGNGTGKTAFESMAVNWFLLTRFQSIVPCTAISKPQLEGTFWPEIDRWRNKSDYLRYRLIWTSTHVRMRGYESTWFAIARTAVNSKGQVTEALQGFHAPFLLYIVDEASGVPDKAVDALESATTSEGSYGIMCSNPTRRSGVFFNAFHKSRALWTSVHVDPEESSFMSDEFKHRMEIKYGGKETNGYRIRVGGEFPLQTDVGLVSYEEYNHPEVQIRGADPSKFTGICILTVDPAGSSPEADATTIGIRIGNDVATILTYHGKKAIQIKTILDELIREYAPKFLFIDSIGLGSELCGFMEEAYPQDLDFFVRDPDYIRVCRINVGKTADNNTDYFNKRSELYWHCAQAIKQRTIRIHQDLPFLETDLTELQHENTLTRKFKVEPKDAFRERNEGRSTDYGDAYMLMFAQIGLEQIEIEPVSCTIGDVQTAFDVNSDLIGRSIWQEEEML